MNIKMHKAIRLLNNYSLSVISSDIQIKNGTIMIADDLLGTNYTIHKNGYVRKRILGWCGELNHYQLNPVKKYNLNKRWEGSYDSERILFPGKYVKLAKIVVRVANKERKRKLGK